jgi:hypothetical protein
MAKCCIFSRGDMAPCEKLEVIHNVSKAQCRSRRYRHQSCRKRRIYRAYGDLVECESRRRIPCSLQCHAGFGGSSLWNDLKRCYRHLKVGPSAFPVQVSTSFSDLQEFGSKIIGPHIATERPSAPVRPYAPGMRKNLKESANIEASGSETLNEIGTRTGVAPAAIATIFATKGRR